MISWSQRTIGQGPSDVIPACQDADTGINQIRPCFKSHPSIKASLTFGSLLYNSALCKTGVHCDDGHQGPTGLRRDGISFPCTPLLTIPFLIRHCHLSLPAPPMKPGPSYAGFEGFVTLICLVLQQSNSRAPPFPSTS